MHKWLICIVLFAFILSGCAAAQETQPVNTIVFSFPEKDLALYRSLINDFYVRYPGITVQLDPVPGHKLNEQKGDVQVVSWDVGSNEITWSADDFIDLWTLIAGDETVIQEDFFPGVMLPFTDVDKLAAIPYGMDLDMLYYNRELFDQQEVPAPASDWNWDNFLEIAARLTDREHNIFGYAALVNYTDSLYFLYQNDGYLLNDDAIPMLDSRANIEAMGWYGRLFTTLNVAPTAEQAQRSFGFGENVFALGIKAGKVGMWSAPFSTKGVSPTSGDALAFEYGIAPLPREKINATSGVFEAYAIAHNTKNSEACWNLIKFLSQQPNPRLIPARKSIASSLDYAKITGAEAAGAANISASHAIVVRYDQAKEFIKARQAFLQAVTSIVSLESTPKQALEDVQKSIKP